MTQDRAYSGVYQPTIQVLQGLRAYFDPEHLKIKAITINNAREFKIDSQVGTIEPGKIADLVLLKKSPLESVDAYDSIVTVWIHGKQVSRDSLAANPNK